MKINPKFIELDDEGLATYETEVREAAEALVAGENPTDKDIEEAASLIEHLNVEIAAEKTARVDAASSRAERLADLRSRLSAEPEAEAEEIVEEEPEAEAEVEEEPVEETVEVVAEVEPEVEKVAAAAKTTTTAVKKVAAAVKRPAKPALSSKPVTITAAADVPGFATGSGLDDLAQVGQTVINRLKSLPPPTGNGETEDLRTFGAASFRIDFPTELTLKASDDDMTVLTHARQESRLPGQALTASAGWCAPSETLYDLCASETTEGILSIPEVNVTRGGIKYTSGPDFSTIYSGVGFLQTEAQAISGTTKTCYEVPCPTFTDVRLDAIGLCIKVPILLNSAYPEVTQRIMSGALIAHQHKVNASVISRMVTAAGTANAVQDFGGTAQNTLAALELLADRLRQKYVLSFSQSMEVVLPFWVKGAIRSDLSLRTGVDVGAVTDGMIQEHFSARALNVQFVYDWQPLVDYATTEGYPATYQALIYPSGTFIKGTSDVINLSAVYDAASLVVNIYTGLFFEQGLLVAKMCNEAMLVTLPMCGAGRTGIANIAQCGTGA